MIEKRGSEKICGTCKWRKNERTMDEWMCANRDSECCAIWMGYNDTCDEWEGRR